MPKRGVVLERAVRFLEKQDPKAFSTMDCARILTVLPPIPEILELRRSIAGRLERWLSSGSTNIKGDLLPTFCVLQALHDYNPALVRGDHLAVMVRRLVQLEVKVGGPYVSSDGMVRMPDNVEVAVFMNTNGIHLPALHEFLVQELQVLPSSVRASYYLLLWQLTALKDDAFSTALSKHLNREPHSRASTATRILHAAAQARLGVKIRIPQIVIDRQQADGSWSAAALPGMTRAGTIVFITGIAAGLLQTSQNKTSDPWLRPSKAVHVASTRQVRHLDEPLRSSMYTALDRIQQVDTVHEITMLPEFFNGALKPAARQNKRVTRLLGQANVFAWIAYVIYDDFMDDEGDVPALPVANVAVRSALLNYNQVMSDDAVFQKYISQTFDRVDAANAWEVAHCRMVVADQKITIGTLPDFGNLNFLADRTFIHALSPLALARLTGVALVGKCWEALEQGFRHYLIARQLNDDIHDWCKDLSAGHITVVVKMLLEEMNIQPGTYPLEVLVGEARPIFWRKTLVRLADLAQDHCAGARKAFLRSQLLTKNNSLTILIDTIENTVRDGLAQRTKSQDFLRRYEAESTDC